MTMSDEIREQLSALADDELGELERPLLLGRLQREPQLRECLGRYHLIGELMRGAGRSAGLGIAGRVQSALAAEAALRQRRAVTWWRPLAGLAVAASVALVAVLGVTGRQDAPSGTSPLASAQVPADGLVQAQATGPETARPEQWDRIEPRVDRRLSGYLVNHSEFAINRGVQGVLPYARVVSDTHP
ncbi:MAG TPA: hypothetical protein ENJ79_11420 [Gammaproteobacteria bacterium]|nr:hypothetical protein [Gammaproteobacteria bacterium]